MANSMVDDTVADRINQLYVARNRSMFVVEAVDNAFDANDDTVRLMAMVPVSMVDVRLLENDMDVLIVSNQFRLHEKKKKTEY